MVIVGWDVSTSAIGICVREADGRVREFGVIYPVGDTPLKKHADVVKQVETFVKRVVPEGGTHFVEDRLAGFGGKTTAATLMALASMNAVVSLALSAFGPVTHIPPITTKRIVGLKVPKGEDTKEAKVKFVRAREPSMPYAETKAGNRVKGTDDMADAWLLSEAGRLIMRGEASIGSPKKAAGDLSKARAPRRGRKSQGGVGIPVSEPPVRDPGNG